MSYNNEPVLKKDSTGSAPADRRQQSGTQQRRGSGGSGSATLMPAVDVFENQDGITLYADMPGVAQDKLDLHVEADTLTIEGEVSLELPEGMQASHADVALSRYRRVFTLSKELDAEKVSADLKNGVLTLRIPKAAHAQPRRIQVSAS